jgi:hypothetical protein
MEYTPDKITRLEQNEYVVVGTNTEGRSGKGFALECVQKFGLQKGHKRGISGQCYAIITKDLTYGLRSIPLPYIQRQIQVLYRFAKVNSDKIFFMTKIGTNHAGYTEGEIKGILDEIESHRPDNVRLPKFNL